MDFEERAAISCRSHGEPAGSPIVRAGFGHAQIPIRRVVDADSDAHPGHLTYRHRAPSAAMSARMSTTAARRTSRHPDRLNEAAVLVQPHAVVTLAAGHVLHQPTSASPAQLLALQRTAGNAAVTGVVQRVKPSLGQMAKEGVAPLGIGLLDQGAGVKGAAAGGEIFEQVDGKAKFFNPNADGAQWAQGVGGAGIGMALIGNAVGGGLDSAAIHKLRKRLDDPNLTPLERAAIERELRTRGGDLGGRVGGVVGNILDFGAIGVNAVDPAALAAGAAAGVGAAAAGGAGVLQAYNVVRAGAKASSQHARKQRLHEMQKSWDNPSEALVAAKAEVALLQGELEAANAAYHDIVRADMVKGTPTAAADRNKQPAADAVEAAKQALAAAEARFKPLEKKFDDMRNAVTAKDQSGKPSLQEIAAYAELKQKRGLKKKLVEMIGGTIGVGGSIALAVAAATGGALVMASPVGWALAATAAAAAIGLGVYKLVKWWRRRRSDQPDKRRSYAKRLYELGLLDTDQGVQARRVILNLGGGGFAGGGGFIKVVAPDKDDRTLDTAGPRLKTEMEKLETASSNGDERPRKKFVAYLASKMAS